MQIEGHQKRFISLFFLLSGLMAWNGILCQSVSCDTLFDQHKKRYKQRSDFSLEDNATSFQQHIENGIMHNCPLTAATASRALGNLYKNAGKYTQAAELYDRAISIDTEAKDTLGMAKNYNCKTTLAYNTDLPIEGIRFAEKGLALLPSPLPSRWKSLANSLIYNKASCLRELKRYEEAKEIYEHLAKDSLWRNADIALLNVANIAFDQSRFEEARDIYLKVFPLFEEDLYELSHVTHSLGMVYRELGDTLLAKKYFLKSKEQATASNSNVIYSYALMDLLRLPPPWLSKDSLALLGEELLQFSKQQTGNTQDKSGMLFEMASDFLRNGQGLEALQLIRSYSLETGDLEVFDIYQQASKQAVLEKRLQQRKSLSIGGGLLALSLILFLLYANKRKREKLHLTSSLLQEEKRSKKLMQEKQELEFNHTEDKLKSAYELRQRLALRTHDLKGVASGVRNGLSAFVDHFGSSPPSLDHLQRVHHHASSLYDRLRNVSKEMEPDVTEWYHELENMLENLRQDTQIETTIQETNIKGNKIDAYIGYRIVTSLRVLLDNVREHAQASQVHLSLAKKENRIVVICEDNGVGFDINKVEGLGLRTVRQKIEKELNGTLTIKHTRGTHITIDIPIPDDHYQIE